MGIRVHNPTNVGKLIPLNHHFVGEIPMSHIEPLLFLGTWSHIAELPTLLGTMATAATGLALWNDLQRGHFCRIAPRTIFFSDRRKGKF